MDRDYIRIAVQNALSLFVVILQAKVVVGTSPNLGLAIIPHIITIISIITLHDISL